MSQTKSTNIIFTVQENMGEVALNEIKKVYPESSFKGWISPSMGMANVPAEFPEVAEMFLKEHVVFIRHICPVDLKVEFVDIESLDAHIDGILEQLDTEASFSVQTRTTKNFSDTYKNFDINNYVAERLSSKGCKLDVKAPTQIVSIVCKDENVYIGVSLAKENLSNWAGGVRRFAFEEDQISRAEFKLLEIIELLDLDFDQFRSALDLGAAPGGWTRVLLKYDLFVTAVDPAKMDEKILKNPNVTHFKGLAQDFLKEDYRFDVIVNDMRMDVYESVKLMGIAAEYLSDRGIAILTLKLPTKKTQKITNDALKMLRKWFDIFAVRQLFNNRSEVTVVLKKKEGSEEV